jgi:hypothetical protein
VFPQVLYFEFENLIGFIREVSEFCGVVLDFGLLTEFPKPLFLVYTHYANPGWCMLDDFKTKRTAMSRGL